MWSGCGIAAALVVRRHDVRAEVADEPDQALGRLLERDQGEAALGQRRLGVALGPAGVDEAEPVLPDAEDVAGAVHLLAPDLGDVLQDVGAVHLGVEHRAALAAGAGGDVDVDALRDVLRRRRGTLARLVVGVGVHVHESKAGAEPVCSGPVCGGRGHGRESRRHLLGFRRDHRPRGPVRRTRAVATPGHDRPGCRARRGVFVAGWPGRRGSTAPRGRVRARRLRRHERPQAHGHGEVELEDGVDASCRRACLAEDHTTVGELAFTPSDGATRSRSAPSGGPPASS